MSDTERIDWLESNEFSVESHREGDEDAEIWWTVTTKRGKCLTHPYGNWRAAVDMAMEAHECVQNAAGK